MILVDSSVWIDYFNGVATPASDSLDQILDREPLAVGDLILTEVLQGFRHDRDYRTAKELLLSLTIVDMLGQVLAIKAAANMGGICRYGNCDLSGFGDFKTGDDSCCQRSFFSKCIQNSFQVLYFA